MKLLAMMFMAMILIGCAEPSPGSIDVSGSLGGGELKTVVLDDGTPCAVLIGFKKAAISCGWK